MRAYEIQTGFGLDNLVLTNRPDPEAPGPGEVVVDVKAVSLNYRDLMVVRGQYNPKQALPLVPGSDGAGVVRAVGPGVEHVSIGDRVMGAFCPRWLEGEGSNAQLRHALGSPLDGMLREQATLEAASLVAIPDRLSFEDASTLPCAATTAWHALVHVANVKPGQTVCVLGTGGVSLFALQIAQLCGAEVFVTSSSDDKLEMARTLGASFCVNYRTTPQWGKAIRAHTKGQGVDVVVEVGGAGTLNQSLRAIRTGGTIPFIGVLAEADDAPALVNVLMNNIRLQGIYVGSRAMLAETTRAIETHHVVPVIDEVFDFDDVGAAFAKMAAGKHFGKIVVRVG